MKSGRQTTKDFQPCLWRLLVSLKSPQGSLQRCEERAVGWGSSHTLPLPLLCGTYQGKGLFRFWNNLPQGQLPWPISFSMTNILLKMDPHCPENEVRRWVCNAATQFVSQNFLYFKPGPLLICLYAMNDLSDNFCLWKLSPSFKLPTNICSHEIFFSCFPMCPPFSSSLPFSHYKPPSYL